MPSHTHVGAACETKGVIWFSTFSFDLQAIILAYWPNHMSCESCLGDEGSKLLPIRFDL